MAELSICEVYAYFAYSENHTIRHFDNSILYIRIHEEQQKAIEKAVTKVRAEEKAERDRLQSENEMLRAENEELKKKYAMV